MPEISIADVSVVILELPTCNICRARDAVVDGATIMGPWAYMCDPCFGREGIGYGLGVGQRLFLDWQTSVRLAFVNDLSSGTIPRRNPR